MFGGFVLQGHALDLKQGWRVLRDGLHTVSVLFAKDYRKNLLPCLPSDADHAFARKLIQCPHDVYFGS